MEYILTVSRIVPLTQEEKDNADRNQRKGMNYDSYPSGVGQSYDVRQIQVLNVTLTDVEYEAAKKAIIAAKT